MPRRVRYSRPRGGVHYWLRLDSRIDGRRLLRAAVERGVAFAPGEMFYAVGAGKNEIRLCYTSVTPRKIEEGVKLLAAAIEDQLRNKPSVLAALFYD